MVKTAVKKSWKIELEKEMKALLREQIRNNKRRQEISMMFSMHHISQDFQSSWQKNYNPYILVYLSKKEELFTAQSAGWGRSGVQVIEKMLFTVSAANLVRNTWRDPAIFLHPRISASICSKMQ